MKEQEELNAKINTLSELVGRSQLALTMGVQFNGNRALYDVLGYPTKILPIDCFNKYYRHDLSQAIINKPVDKTWRGDVAILEADDDKETALETAWNELYTDLSLKSTFIQADKLTGLNEYGVIFLGFNDVTDSAQLALPVNQGLSKLQLLYVRAFGANKALINTYDTNPASKRYCKPELYQIQIEDTLNLTVHHSRIIHIIDNPLESEVKGKPRLEVVFNRLEDLEKLLGGSAEMYWKGARPGYHGKIDPDYTMSDTTKADLKDQMEEYEHNLRRFITLQGMEIKELGTQVADPKSHVEIQLMMISAVTNIPQRILLGSERGELASSQDADEWLSYIAARRESFAELRIIKPFVNRLIEYKVLPAQMDGKNYTIQWDDLFAQSEKDTVEIGKGRTAALKDYVSSAEVQTIVPPEAFLEMFLGLPPEKVTLINAMREAWMNEEQNRIAQEEAEQPEEIPDEIIEEETEE